MKKFWLVAVVVVAVLVVLFFMRPRINLSKNEYLKEPQITNMPRQNMLVAEVKGAPGTAVKDGYSALFKTFFKLKVKMADCPRGRYPKPFNTPMEEWVSILAIPIPDSINTLPQQVKNSKADVRIEYWEYGDVAEILHIGPYGKETPTIEKLYKFIEDNGYKIAGPHEEVYLKGPESIFTKPDKYMTIIRYQVKKK